MAAKRKGKKSGAAKKSLKRTAKSRAGAAKKKLKRAVARVKARATKSVKKAAKKVARAASPIQRAIRKAKAKRKAAAPKRPARAAKKAKRSAGAQKQRRAPAARKRPRLSPVRSAEAHGLVVERPAALSATGTDPVFSSLPPPPPEDAVEVSGIYERVLYSENDPYAEVREVFNHYDRDRSGTIEANEFVRVCEALGVEMLEEELQVGLSIVDADRDGKISWDEFLGWWSNR